VDVETGYLRGDRIVLAQHLSRHTSDSGRR
jgi:hypothetical protein